MSTRKLTFDGREVDGTDIPFEIIKDGMLTLELEDGARLHVKPIIINVVKTDELTPSGAPVYGVQSIMHVSLADRPVEKPQ